MSEWAKVYNQLHRHTLTRYAQGSRPRHNATTGPCWTRYTLTRATLRTRSPCCGAILPLRARYGKPRAPGLGAPGMAPLLPGLAAWRPLHCQLQPQPQLRCDALRLAPPRRRVAARGVHSRRPGAVVLARRPAAAGHCSCGGA